MSELDREESQAESATPIVKGNCLVFGHVFGPGTTVKRPTDKKIFTLEGVMSNWRMDGEVIYLGIAEDKEQAWILESALMTPDEQNWQLENEVNANDIAARREK
jgi:hypothetical protein